MLLKARTREITLMEVLNLINSYDPTAGYSPGTGKFSMTVSSFTADGDRFFANVSHNLNNEDVDFRCKYADNSMYIEPQEVRTISPNVTKFWFRGNSRNVRISIWE